MLMPKGDADAKPEESQLPSDRPKRSARGEGGRDRSRSPVPGEGGAERETEDAPATQVLTQEVPPTQNDSDLKSRVQVEAETEDRKKKDKEELLQACKEAAKKSKDEKGRKRG